ncbi:MAG: glycosyltransferase [Spirochaetia bacterium]|nr:glycosyltransferase [Spirochaetia bacterium]MCF7941088.1 glycosyltransferase [Spirochaetia bacterium]
MTDRTDSAPKPFFSIITVCYNSSKTLQRCIDSVLRQRSPEFDFEYIVVDGASTDSTVEMIRSNEPRFNGTMRWISEPDEGLYFAMNKGLSLAEGHVVAFMNSDDWYEEDALHTVYTKFIEQPETDIVYGHVRIVSSIDSDKTYELSQDTHENLTRGMTISHPACFIRNTVFSAHGNFNTRYRISGDFELLLRYYLQGVTFTAVDAVLSTFPTGGASSDLWKLMKEEYHIQKEYVGRVQAVRKYCYTLCCKVPKSTARDLLGDARFEQIKERIKRQ